MSADITRLLNGIESNDPRAADELLPQVLEEFRKLAAARKASASLAISSSRQATNFIIGHYHAAPYSP